MNKKVFLVILAIILHFSLNLFAFVNDDTQNEMKSEFILPASLLMVDDEAFAGTAVETLVFPEGAEYIGKNILCGTSKLVDVFLPETIRYIDDSAFSWSCNFIIHGLKDSYVEKWANEHQIQFVVDDEGRAILQKSSIFDFRRIFAHFFIKLLLWYVLIIIIHKRNIDLHRKQFSLNRPELIQIDYCFP